MRTIVTESFWPQMNWTFVPAQKKERKKRKKEKEERKKEKIVAFFNVGSKKQQQQQQQQRKRKMFSHSISVLGGGYFYLGYVVLLLQRLTLSNPMSLNRPPTSKLRSWKKSGLIEKNAL